MELDLTLTGSINALDAMEWEGKDRATARTFLRPSVQNRVTVLKMLDKAYRLLWTWGA
jgi:hypothetical protein